MTGAATHYAHSGTGISSGQMAGTAYISSAQVSAYNAALSGMTSYLPYGSAQTYLEEQAQAELDLMDAAIDVFTAVVVDILAVQNVAEQADAASTPDEEAAVQEFVANNIDTLQIDQGDADTYNQSLDEIETHANAAGAFLGVAANPEAVAFIQAGAVEANTTVEENTLTYSASNQAVSIAWTNNSTVTDVYVNGTDQFNINLYASNADILTAGAETQFFLTSPTALGYQCFVYGLECAEGDT